MVAKLLLIVGICALLYVGCQALQPGSGLIAAVPPSDPTEAAAWSAGRTEAAGTSSVESTRQAGEQAGTQDARQASKRQSDQDAQATLDERARRAEAEQRYAASTAEAHREQSTQAAQAATAKAENARRKETQSAQETETEREWIAQGWTATADSARSATQAVIDQQAADRQATADAAGVQALQTAQAAQAFVIAQKATQESLKTARMEAVNNVEAWAPYVAGPLVGIAICVGFWYWRRHQVIPRDSNGQAPVVRVGDKLMDPERSILPVLDPNVPIQGDREAHLRITENAQKVQALRQLQGKANPGQALGLIKSQPAVATADGNGHQPHPPAPWSAFIQATGPVPLGMGQNGSLQIPGLDEWPHRLFAGKTGAGKSRYGLRPFVAGSLGRGWNVAILGDRKPVDMKVFIGHPNFYDLTQEDPAVIVRYLEAIQIEIKRREEVLWNAGVSTWSRLPKADPRVVVVFDEFAALIDALEGPVKADFIKGVSNISRLARKVGIHLACGVQNPTADNIRPSIRRNMLPIAFQVTDTTASRVILEEEGAEKLIPPEYLARMLTVVLGVGFDPSDEQIDAYLDSRHVPAYDPPPFLVHPVELPSPEEHKRLDLPDREIQTLAEQIRLGWETKESKRALARRVGEEYAGAFCKKLDAAIAYLAAATATTTPADPPGPAPATFVNSSSSSSSTFGD